MPVACEPWASSTHVHHQANGAPYAARTELADRVISAAREAGLRVSLLRVVYARAGAGKPAEGAQLRFCDPRLDDALSDVEALASKWAHDEGVRVGIAPHSVRAVPPAWLPEIASFAKSRDLPIHMHVAEQPAEIEACVAETGKRPVELLADLGVLDARFVAVHATHLAPHEARLLGQARAFVCFCPTTERDLGDGLPGRHRPLGRRRALRGRDRQPRDHEPARGSPWHRARRAPPHDEARRDAPDGR